MMLKETGNNSLRPRRWLCHSFSDYPHVTTMKIPRQKCLGGREEPFLFHLFWYFDYFIITELINLLLMVTRFNILLKRSYKMDLQTMDHNLYAVGL